MTCYVATMTMVHEKPKPRWEAIRDGDVAPGTGFLQYTYWVDSLNEAESLLNFLECRSHLGCINELACYGVTKFRVEDQCRCPAGPEYRYDICLRLRDFLPEVIL